MGDIDSQDTRALEFLAPPAVADMGTPVGHTGVHDAEFEELFRLYGPRLGRFLAQVVSSRSLGDDLLQETFLTAWGKRDRLASVENPEAWLFAIARNHALQALRRRRRALRALQRLARERVQTDPGPAEAIAVRDHLARFLNPEERILLVLRYAHGFGSKDLSEIVGRSSEAIRQQMSRARRKLIDSLDETASPPLHPERTEHD